MNISKDTVKETFQRETKNATSQWLGRRFQLKGVTVRAIDPVIEAITETPLLELKVKDFTVNFTITNLPYRVEMRDPNSKVYHDAKASIEGELNQLYQRSDLAANFVGCSVENFRPTGWKNETAVNSICTFMKAYGPRTFERDFVYNVFKNLTGKGSMLGKYMLDDRTLLVNGYSSEVSPVPYRKDLPFWAIILICLSVLLGFVLLFLMCFLARRRAGKYQVQQNIFGNYFPHLDMRRTR
ncbi:mucin-16-like [Sceloporus undulatus]|uniref:mucin-16-like n=1 Tax=Sceloporus undulatus TaxID=8520 RepID=UPI001C4DA777|nr:mucin-16-like [Sceloporus undulatus]